MINRKMEGNYIRTGACKNSIQELLNHEEETIEKVAKDRRDTLGGAIRKFNQNQKLIKNPLFTTKNYNNTD